MPYGSMGHIGIGREVTWNTPVAATDYIPLDSETIVEEIEQVEDPSIKESRFENKNIPGLVSVKGSTIVGTRPTSIGYLLRSALGAVAVTGVNPYTHTFTPAASAFDPDCYLPSYTLEIHRDLAQAWQYAGMVVNALQFAYGAKQKILKATADWLGKSAALITKTAPTFEAAQPFTWAQAAVSLGGTNFDRLEDFSFKLDNKLEAVELLKSANANQAGKIWPNGKIAAELDLTMDLNDQTEYTNFKTSVDRTMVVTFTAATNILKITIPSVRLINHPLNISGPGRITVKAKGKAFLDNTFKVELTNAKTSYTT